MLNFEDIEHLVSHMFETVNGDEPVSVVADKDLAVEIMGELLSYKNVIITNCEIDVTYGHEYLVTLIDDEDTDYWYVDVVQIYDDNTGSYYVADGYVLFHEDVNSKIQVDMERNEFVEITDFGWFTIGEDDSFESDEDEN